MTDDAKRPLVVDDVTRARPFVALATRLPFVVGCAAIWWVSAQARPLIPEPLTFRGSDKLLHFTAYCGLALLAAAPLFTSTRRAGLVAREAFVLAGLYGVVDELHQRFVPGRDASLADVVADVLGAALGAWLAARFGVGVVGALVQMGRRMRERPLTPPTRRAADASSTDERGGHSTALPETAETAPRPPSSS